MQQVGLFSIKLVAFHIRQAAATKSNIDARRDSPSVRPTGCRLAPDPDLKQTKPVGCALYARELDGTYA